MLSALNWQRGITAAHRVPEGAAIGPWTVIGVWAHQDSSDQQRFRRNFGDDYRDSVLASR